MIPPLNFSAGGGTAKSGDASQGLSSSGGDFNVNYGSGVTQGGGMPSWVWMAAVGIAGLLVWKKYQ